MCYSQALCGLSLLRGRNGDLSMAVGMVNTFLCKSTSAHIFLLQFSHTCTSTAYCHPLQHRQQPARTSKLEVLTQRTWNLQSCAWTLNLPAAQWTHFWRYPHQVITNHLEFTTLLGKMQHCYSQLPSLIAAGAQFYRDETRNWSITEIPHGRCK